MLQVLKGVLAAGIAQVVAATSYNRCLLALKPSQLNRNLQRFTALRFSVSLTVPRFFYSQNARRRTIAPRPITLGAYADRAPCTILAVTESAFA